jgi:nicotinate-nucleotide--dimethylbenzimidazole phosphoribosyltransferase
LSLFEDTLASIKPVDGTLEAAARARLDSLTKPPGSLGHLEDIAARYCLATGTAEPRLGRKAIFTFAGDHGVAEEGVSAFPKEVTPQMVANMLAGGAAVNVLGAHAGAEVSVVDMGVDADLSGPNPACYEGLIDRKVRRGTANIALGPAMTEEEATRALEAGIALAREAAEGGATLLGAGDMGIANTTPSAALFAALLPCAPDEITGRGTGIDDRGLARKVEVVRQALQVNAPRLATPLGCLAAVGGLEIAGIAGLALGAAASGVPVVVDGFISSAGALVACRMSEAVEGYLFFSHLSEEAGHAVFLERFGARPILDLGMRLGEGTGAALAMTVIEAAVKVYNDMATFDSAGVSGKSG